MFEIKHLGVVYCKHSFEKNIYKMDRLSNLETKHLGDVFLPWSEEWKKSGKMKGNHLFDSMFGAVFYPENTGNEEKVKSNTTCNGSRNCTTERQEA